jgi:hypothetical protein
MASISDIKVGSTTYTLQIPFITGTQTAKTGSWTGTASTISALYDGLTIRYWLPYAGSGNATLNLTLADGTTTGAVNCYYSGTSRLTTHYSAGNIITLTYRSGVSISGSSTTYTGWWADANYTDGNTYPSAYCSTSAGTAAKTATCTSYNLLSKSYTLITITTDNTSQTALTLNINSKGAKPIYINGSASSSSNYTLPAGTYLIYYDGTNYYFRTDGYLTANITGSASTSTAATKWSTARNLNGMSVQGDANRVNYGSCSTASATAAKTVACTGFALITGSEITVKFTTTNTATSPTLNVNSTGAKAIYYHGSAILPYYLSAKRTYTFRYDGTNYDLVGDLNDNAIDYTLDGGDFTTAASEYTLTYDGGDFT